MDGQMVMGIATIIAVLAGPVLAVWVTRYIDEKRLKQTRRMDVFRTLMRTRRMRLTPDHVGALNLVEIEFHDQKPVINAWRSYWAHLYKRLPTDQTDQDQFFQDQNRLLAKLLHAMAQSLHFQIEQFDIFDGGYAPQGWEQDEQTVRLLRVLLLDVLSGTRGIPVVPLNLPIQNSPFPPPPEISSLSEN